jgi:hypothetical protein
MYHHLRTSLCKSPRCCDVVVVALAPHPHAAAISVARLRRAKSQLVTAFQLPLCLLSLLRLPSDSLYLCLFALLFSFVGLCWLSEFLCDLIVAVFANSMC